MFRAFDEGRRGRLLPLELADVDFAVRRVFTVTGHASGSDRGDHVVTCAELLVLVSGSVSVEVDGTVTVLGEPGQGLRLERGHFVRYTLSDDRTTMLVLADQPYDAEETRP